MDGTLKGVFDPIYFWEVKNLPFSYTLNKNLYEFISILNINHYKYFDGIHKNEYMENKKVNLLFLVITYVFS